MRVYIVHRWDGSPNGDWYPWLKRELEKRGWDVVVPKMPETSTPKIQSWVEHVKQAVGKCDENTYFVGHSIGCQTIMRYLAQAPKATKIGGLIFVAGWLDLQNLESDEVKAITKPWLETPIAFEKVATKTSQVAVFLSDNDPYGYLDKNKALFKKHLNAKVVIEEGKGHFTADDGITEIPEVVKQLHEWTYKRLKQ